MGIPNLHERYVEIERVAGSVGCLCDEVPGERQVIYGNSQLGQRLNTAGLNETQLS